MKERVYKMGKMKSEMATRCELALMGKVVPATNDEVQAMTEYIFNAIGKDPSNLVDIVKCTIQKYSKTNEVKYIVCNTVMGMKCITYLLATTSTDEEEMFPAPFEEDYGSGYPASFCFTLNTDSDWCSEFGDCFFEKSADGYYHRVS